MSSFKKRAKSVRKEYRERGQPSHRKHLGFLEKHKDYIERASSYKKKVAQLKILEEKARNRNPDEFYYKMVKTKLRDGQHIIDQPKEEYTDEELKIMKTQDMKYIQMKLAIENKKIEKLEPFIKLKNDEYVNKCNTHIVFVDKDEADLESEEETDQTEATGVADDDSSEITSVPNIKKYKMRQKRCKDLMQVLQKMQTQKHLLNKNEKRVKIKCAESRNVTYKWMKERKR